MRAYMAFVACFFIGVLLDISRVQAQPVALKFAHPEGRTVQYKHTHRLFYFSNQAEILFGVQEMGADIDDEGNFNFSSDFSIHSRDSPASSWFDCEA